MVRPDLLRRKFVEISSVLQKVANDTKIEERLTSASRSSSTGTQAASRSLGSESVPTPQALVFGGITVTAFNAFDEFTANVSRAYVDHMLGAMEREDVPESLILELSYGAIRAFANKSKFFSGASGGKPNSSELIDYSLGLARPIGHLQSGKVSGTSHSFSPQGYDVEFSDLTASLNSFGLKQFLGELTSDPIRERTKGSNYMNRIISSISGLDLGVRFKNVRKRRNDAAHNLSSAFSSDELKTDLRSLIDCAFAYEVALVALVNKIKVDSGHGGGWKDTFLDVPPIAVFSRAGNPQKWKYWDVEAGERARISESEVDNASVRAFSSNCKVQCGSEVVTCRPMAAVFINKGFVEDWRINYWWSS